MNYLPIYETDCAALQLATVFADNSDYVNYAPNTLDDSIITHLITPGMSSVSSVSNVPRRSTPTPPSTPCHGRIVAPRNLIRRATTPANTPAEYATRCRHTHHPVTCEIN